VPLANGFFQANKQFIAPLPIRLPTGRDAEELEELGGLLHVGTVEITRERDGFLDWLSEVSGTSVRSLAGGTALLSFEALTPSEILAVLRRNRSRLGLNPDARSFRETVAEEHATTRDRLAEALVGLHRTERKVEGLVADLYGLTGAQRRLVDREYEAASGALAH
jgi:hypothetical protein